jgi:hypothetical protein
LFVLGFLWGALGGAGTALPALLDRDRLTSLFPPTIAVFAAWTLEDIILPHLQQIESAAYRHQSRYYWYDTDWIAAGLAIVAVLLLAAVRRRICWATSFILHMAIGWWVAFLFMVFLVDAAGIEFRMTPPRGDNWVGITGMTAGAMIYFLRHGLIPVAHAALVSGFFGGFGFATATFLKLVEIKYVPIVLSQAFGEGKWDTNWHSVLEQTYGFLNGIGIAIAMVYLARRLPRASDEPRLRPWTEVIAAFFVLVVITYVNIVKDVSTWVKEKAVPADLYGLSSWAWFNIGYGLVASVVLLLLARHVRSPLAVVPKSYLGKGQLLYLVLLWWMVIGNLMRAIPPFNEQRLITEGVIHLNAVLCTLLILLWPQPTDLPDRPTASISPGSLATVTLLGLLFFGATVAVESYGTRAIHGNKFVGYSGYHVRFGPDAKSGKPEKGKPHP